MIVSEVQDDFLMGFLTNTMKRESEVWTSELTNSNEIKFLEKTCLLFIILAVRTFGDFIGIYVFYI